MNAGAIAWIGAGLFGVVVGWITYRTLRRREGGAQISDLATVIGAVGGAAITSVFDDPDLFGMYCIGLAIGFFGYLAAAYKIEGPAAASVFMGRRERTEPPREPRTPGTRIER